MKSEQRILELLAEVLHKVDALSGEMNGVKGEIKGLKEDVAELKGDVKDLSKRMGRVEKNILKLNIISAENSRAILKLADNSDRRLARLEKVVFKF